jgi:hypothetical protein
MVTECIEYQYRTTESKLLLFLKENQFTSSEFYLMLFWARNPYAKLSLYTITNAMTKASMNIREAIKSLVRRNILIEKQTYEELTTYYLNSNYDLREFVSEIITMNKEQIRSVQKQLEGAAV